MKVKELMSVDAKSCREDTDLATATKIMWDADCGIVPGATHLFEEPGTLDQVSVLAKDWFARHLN